MRRQKYFDSLSLLSTFKLHERKYFLHTFFHHLQHTPVSSTCLLFFRPSLSKFAYNISLSTSCPLLFWMKIFTSNNCIILVNLFWVLEEYAYEFLRYLDKLKNGFIRWHCSAINRELWSIVVHIIQSGINLSFYYHVEYFYRLRWIFKKLTFYIWHSKTRKYGLQFDWIYCQLYHYTWFIICYYLPTRKLC